MSYICNIFNIFAYLKITINTTNLYSFLTSNRVASIFNRFNLIYFYTT